MVGEHLYCEYLFGYGCRTAIMSSARANMIDIQMKDVVLEVKQPADIMNSHTYSDKRGEFIYKWTFIVDSFPCFALSVAGGENKQS